MLEDDNGRPAGNGTAGNVDTVVDDVPNVQDDRPCRVCKAREDADWLAQRQRHRDWWTMPAWERLRTLSYQAGYADAAEDALDTYDPESAFNKGYRLGLSVGVAVGHAEARVRRAA